jgi:hypothetical protein
MSSSIDDLGGDVTGLLVLASIIGAIAWQYVRRKTWASRSLLVSGPLLASLLGVITPYARFVERKYPLISESSAPAHFAPVIPNPRKGKPANRFNFQDSIYLRIPFLVSGIAPGHVIQIRGMRVYVESRGVPAWDAGWKSQWIPLWTESQTAELTFEMERKTFDSMKTTPVRLLLELALTEYEETGARDLVLKDAQFSDQRLGICHLDERNPSQLVCVRPFQAPGGTASFDPSLASCPAPQDDEYKMYDRVSHHWLGAQKDDDFFSPGLNPVADYQIPFGPTLQSFFPEGAGQMTKRVYLCLGARVRLAQPEEKAHMRVQVRMDAVRLQDLGVSEFGWD